MPIVLKTTAEPLAFAARVATPEHPGGKLPVEPILARSRAGVVLQHELGRYCDGQVRGRSFLIAGHRGAGKTTLVDHVVLHFQRQALEGKVRFKPLPVYVHGPLVLPPPAGAAAKPAADDGDDADTQRVLVQVAQALHQAVAREFGDRFHLLARRSLDAGDRDGAERAELAARFQIEYPEAPGAARLQEFWHHAGVLHDGLLFDPGHRRGRQQGLLELVALNGVGHVHQRISGQLEAKDVQKSGASRSVETQVEAGSKAAELVRPLAALAAGGAVGTASAAAGHTAGALLMGLIAAAGAGLVLRFSSTRSRRRERQVDRTFMPDLSTKTLHRVMPELFERLLACGLAPVFVIDELDKVDELYSRIHHLLDSMKKLFAERALTCLLVDRGFYEQLHWREERERLGGGPTPPAARSRRRRHA